MFGLSFGKLLVLAAVVAFVWFGWKRMGGLIDGVKRAGGGVRKSDNARDPETIDLVRDPKTGSYAPKDDAPDRN